MNIHRYLEPINIHELRIPIINTYTLIIIIYYIDNLLCYAFTFKYA